MKWFDNISLALVIIGAVNWLLIGIFRFDLVAFLFGNPVCDQLFWKNTKCIRHAGLIKIRLCAGYT